MFKWSTEDCVTLDKIPYIGKFSNLLPNMYVATGFKKWGNEYSTCCRKNYIRFNTKKESKYANIYTATRLEPIRNIKEFGNILKESTNSLFLIK